MSTSLIATVLLQLFFTTTLVAAQPSSSQCGCIEIFQPVCCRLNSGAVETRSNSCFCECEGSVLFDGECRDPTDCFCPAVFAPVCCKLPSGELETKGNSCECGCQNGSVTKDGACAVPGACICPAIFAPVCCKLPSGELSTVSNSCQCGCANGSVQSNGPCSTPTPSPSPSPTKDICVCTLEYNPVCCKLPSGQLATRSNPCLCTSKICSKGSIAYEGQCSRTKTCRYKCSSKGSKTTCCATKNKVFQTKNACLCKRCNSGKILKHGKCPLCACPKILRPVVCHFPKKKLTTIRLNDCLCTCIGGKVIAPYRPRSIGV